MSQNLSSEFLFTPDEHCIDSLDLYSRNSMSSYFDYNLSPKNEPPSKEIKFILTKDPTPLNSFLQKKTENVSVIKNENNEKLNDGRWNTDEQRRFAEAVFKYGNNWKNIQNHVSTRNLTQIRSHAQKFLMKLKESSFLKNRGFDLSLSWTKVMKNLASNLATHELKEVLFSVEQGDERKVLKKSKNSKNSKKNSNNTKKIKNEEKFENWSNTQENSGSEHSFFEDDYLNKKNINDEEEKEILKNFIKCFNSSSGEITLNSSFEESSEDKEQVAYKF